MILALLFVGSLLVTIKPAICLDKWFAHVLWACVRYVDLKAYA